jgi:hypothetical protein
MIGVIQRLLQLLVLVALGLAILKPMWLPEPIQPIAYTIHHWVVGPDTSWDGFRNTWSYRWQLITTYIPPLRQMMVSLPQQQPTVTPQSVMNLTITTILVNPAKKWESIKQEFMAPPASSSSATAQ